jgi:hypothetical protein
MKIPKKISKKDYIELMKLADKEIEEWNKFKTEVNKRFLYKKNYEITKKN